MEQAIEHATQQTAQDLHMLLDQAQPPAGPSEDPHATPLGKENMATPAGGIERKNNRGATDAAHLGMTALHGMAAQHYLHLVLQLNASFRGATVVTCTQ